MVILFNQMGTLMLVFLRRIRFLGRGEEDNLNMLCLRCLWHISKNILICWKLNILYTDNSPLTKIQATTKNYLLVAWLPINGDSIYIHQFPWEPEESQWKKAFLEKLVLMLLRAALGHVGKSNFHGVIRTDERRWQLEEVRKWSKWSQWGLTSSTFFREAIERQFSRNSRNLVFCRACEQRCWLSWF